MAAYEHTCQKCDHAVFNNHACSPPLCPKCGHPMFSTVCDEPPELREREPEDWR